MAADVWDKIRAAYPDHCAYSALEERRAHKISLVRAAAGAATVCECGWGGGRSVLVTPPSCVRMRVGEGVACL